MSVSSERFVDEARIIFFVLQVRGSILESTASSREMMSSSWREARRIKMPRRAGATEGGARGGGKSLLVVWMRRGGSGGSCSNKSIKTEFMIRGYIHLKGQTRLKLTAGGICKYYIIYVLNIPQPEGVWKMSKHAKVQPIKQKGVAQQSESAWERGDDVTDVGWCLQDPVWDFDLHYFYFFLFSSHYSEVPKLVASSFLSVSP